MATNNSVKKGDIEKVSNTSKTDKKGKLDSGSKNLLQNSKLPENNLHYRNSENVLEPKCILIKNSPSNENVKCSKDIAKKAITSSKCDDILKKQNKVEKNIQDVVLIENFPNKEKSFESDDTLPLSSCYLNAKKKNKKKKNKRKSKKPDEEEIIDIEGNDTDLYADEKLREAVEKNLNENFLQMQEIKIDDQKIYGGIFQLVRILFQSKYKLVGYKEELDEFFTQYKIPHLSTSLFIRLLIQDTETMKNDMHYIFLKCVQSPDDENDLKPFQEYRFFIKESHIYMKLF